MNAMEDPKTATNREEAYRAIMEAWKTLLVGVMPEDMGVELRKRLEAASDDHAVGTVRSEWLTAINLQKDEKAKKRFMRRLDEAIGSVPISLEDLRRVLHGERDPGVT